MKMLLGNYYFKYVFLLTENKPFLFLFSYLFWGIYLYPDPIYHKKFFLNKINIRNKNIFIYYNN